MSGCDFEVFPEEHCVSPGLYESRMVVYVCVCVWLCSCWAPQVHRPSITQCGHYTQAGVEVDNAPTAATAGASTACGSSVWLASSNQADSRLPVCVTDNVTNTHLYTRARKYTQPTHPRTLTHQVYWFASVMQNATCAGGSKV